MKCIPKYLVMAFMMLASAASCQKKDSPVPEPEKPVVTIDDYTEIQYSDFKIKMKTYLMETSDAKAALEHMKENLDEINSLLPASALEVMHKNPIWMERDIQPEGAAWYHTSIDWLREQGYNIAKVKCVEISNYVNYVNWSKQNQPFMVLHELCHLYHDAVYGFEDPEIKNAYQHAVDSHMYINTGYFDGYNNSTTSRAYALTNQMEYFAEICEAYWGRNDYYPYDYNDLKEYDEVAFALMEKIWGKRDVK